MEFVVIVEGPDGRVVARNLVRAPVSIGRGEQAPPELYGHTHLRVPDAPTVMSRMHVTLELDPAGTSLVLTAHGSNGVGLNGAQLPLRGAARFAPGDVALFAGYALKVEASQAAPPPIAQPPQHAARHGTQAFGAALFSGDRQEATLDLTRAQARARLAPGQAQPHLSEKSASASPADLLSDPTALYVLSGEGGATLHVASTPPTPVMVNRSPVGPGPRPLEPFDLVSAGALEVGILPQGERAIRCHNVECRRLNPYDPRLNCRWCGFRLVDGVTVMLRP